MVLHCRRPGGSRSGAVLLGLLVFAGCGGGNGPIQIGLTANFTDPLSAPIRNGAQLAAEEINAAGGIGGRPIELVEREDYADADSAVVVATDFYNSPVVAVIGHGFSGPTLAAAPVYNGGDNPLLEIAPAASAPAITDAGPYTFRLCPSDLAHGAALAHWSRERLGLQRAAIFYTNSEYGRGIRKAFEAEFASLQGSVTGAYPYLGDEPDVGPYVDLLLRDRRAQFMVIAGYDPDGRTILTTARAKNLTIPAMGGDGLEQIALAGTAANGTYVTSSYFAATDTPVNRRFTAAYRARYPNAGDPNGSGAAAYDAVYMLRDAIGRVGTDRKKLRDAFAGIGTESPAYAGAMGTIAFDENGDVPSLKIYIGQVENGVMQPVGGQ
ncbi:MAG TPA: branched-chain amino acid ABC transporter substrate-binding protein [Gemmatimonadales bacterium]|nr:branched-chain amino acid ABC transporter substrate-binding protein [Gemmatimonadales bacterium]